MVLGEQTKTLLEKLMVVSNCDKDQALDLLLEESFTFDEITDLIEQRFTNIINLLSNSDLPDIGLIRGMAPTIGAKPNKADIKKLEKLLSLFFTQLEKISPKIKKQTYSLFIHHNNLIVSMIVNDNKENLIGFEGYKDYQTKLIEIEREHTSKAVDEIKGVFSLEEKSNSIDVIKTILDKSTHEKAIENREKRYNATYESVKSAFWFFIQLPLIITLGSMWVDKNNKY